MGAALKGHRLGLGKRLLRVDLVNHRRVPPSPTNNFHTRSRMALLLLLLLINLISRQPVRSTRTTPLEANRNSQRNILRSPSRPEHQAKRSRLLELLLLLPPSHNNKRNRKYPRTPHPRKLRQDLRHGLVAFRLLPASPNDPVSVLRRSIPTKCSRCIWDTLYRHLDRPVQTRHQRLEPPRYLRTTKPPSPQKRRKRNPPRKTSRSKPDWCILITSSARRRRWLGCQGTHLFPTARERQQWRRSLRLQSSGL